MGKEKFVYNSQTLQYEKVKNSIGTKLLRIFGFICSAVFAAFILTLLLHRFFPSPREQALLREVEQLKVEYKKLEKELEILDKELVYLKERDAYAHRVIFEMDPIDEGIWEGGIGGHDKYKDYKQFKNSGDLMIRLKEKAEKLKRKMYIQSKSLDTIITMASEKEHMLASIPSMKPISSDKLKRHIKYLSGFGMRIHPVLKVPKMHYGIDFTAPRGTEIQATGNGTVVRANFSSTYGYVVEIDHGYGYKSLYAHMNKFFVKRGDKVVRGQKIGLVGSTGRSTAPHLHYEIRHKGRQINPISHCLDGLTTEEYDQLINAANTVNQSFDYTNGDD